ncbi:MAG: hypothetical protein HOE48_08530 [Candidatus Latescibacteria bacterium]|nr:hypothetical protein [Candidatus Latescibacterota bacterium]
MVRLFIYGTFILFINLGTAYSQSNTLPEPGYIATFMGGYLGDGSSATQASLNSPQDVFVDAQNNIYIADSEFNRVRKIDTAGIITTVAGGSATTTQPYGDDGPATDGYLREPSGIFVDNTGIIYIADQGLSRIRKVDTAGIITTIAGTGDRGFDGDGGLATEAKLANPSSIHLDSAGNLYIADEQNRRVRKVDTAGIITTIAGNGAFASFTEGTPATETGISVKSIYVDNNGTLYISDGFARIKKVDESGNIVTFAGGGSNSANEAATEAELKSPVGMWGDANGNLFIAERDASLIRKVDANNNITTVAGGYLGDGQFRTQATLVKPKGLSLDTQGNLYVADYDHHRVRKVNATNGTVETVAGTGVAGSSIDGGLATESIVSLPVGIGLDQTNNLYVSGQTWSTIQKIDTANIITTIAGGGNETTDDILATQARLSSPSDVAFDQANNLYIADLNNHKIRKIDANGTITTIAGTGQFGSTGDDGPAIEALFNRPTGLTFDTLGNLYIADTGNKRIRKIDTSGTITTIAGGGTAGFPTYGHNGTATDAQLVNPTDVAIDTTGNLYIADGRLIRKIDTAGIITNLAGDGITNSSTGDGGLATDAKLAASVSLVISTDGFLYFSDDLNHRIRVINLNIPETTALTPDFNGDGDVGFADFLAFVSVFGARTGQSNFDPKFDLDSSGDVGFSDFLTFVTAFGKPLGG